MNPNTPIEQRITKLIELFEGSAGGKINVWDEQYLSFGTMHFAVGQMVGARLLIRIYDLDPAGVLSCLGAQFVEAIRRGPAAVVGYCAANVWRRSGWQQAFAALSRLDAYAVANAEFCEPYLAAGKRVAARYGLTSERGLAFAVDRCVQQGERIRPLVEQAYARTRNLSEENRMEALAHAYADTAMRQYHDTVLRRALTVAHGTSARSGYPGKVNLEAQFGISGRRSWKAQPRPNPAPPTVTPLPADKLPRVFLRDLGDKEWILWDGKPVPYAGQMVTAKWVSEIARAHRPGAVVKFGNFALKVEADGALMLRRV